MIINKVIIDGKIYIADSPKLKTIHEKTGEVVIGGFREIKREDETEQTTSSSSDATGQYKT